MYVLVGILQRNLPISILLLRGSNALLEALCGITPNLFKLARREFKPIAKIDTRSGVLVSSMA
jgi:hypothetical protein